MRANGTVRGAAALALACAIGIAAVAAGAQDSRRVARRADLKWSATGRLLGWLGPGARIEPLASREGWTRSRVRGWVDDAAVGERGGQYEIVLDEAELRAARGGAIVGGLRRGLVVERRGAAEGAVEVAAIGWIDDAAFAAGDSAPAPAAVADSAAAEPAPGGSAVAGARVSRPAPLRRAPGSAPIVTLPAGSAVRVLESRGGWSRVAVEGWVPTAALAAPPSGGPEPAVVAAADPEAYAGRAVAWTLEHVSLQQADRWRTDFAEGETFALARVPGGAGLTVYLVVPDALAARFRALAPFERLRVEGTVRTGRSALTGSPIVDVARVSP